MDNHRALGPLIGRNVRRLREATDRSQDDVARSLRMLGLNWNRSTLAKVERGQRGISLEEIVLLAFHFGIPAADLIEGEGTVALTEGERSASMSASDLAEVLRGATPDVRDLDAPVHEKTKETVQQARESLKRLTERWPDLKTWEFSLASSAASGDVERNAAKHFDVTPFDVSMAAVRLWGRSLSDEREARVAEQSTPDASPRSLQAIRGHVTRQLLQELRERGLR